MEMTDPQIGMASFQEALENGIVSVSPVRNHHDLYKYIDRPSPNIIRLTYAHLAADQKRIRSYLVCVLNGFIKGQPCVSVGYAVPERLRNKGYAKEILAEVIQDQIFEARRNRIPEVYIEAMIDITNIASQRVAQSILTGSVEHLTDKHSGRPAIRYTSRFDTATGKQIPIE